MPLTQLKSSNADSTSRLGRSGKLISFLFLAIFFLLALAQASYATSLRFHFGPNDPFVFLGLEGLMLSEEQVASLSELSIKIAIDAKNTSGRKQTLIINSRRKDEIDTTNRNAYDEVVSLQFDEVELSSYKFLNNLPALRDAQLSATSQINQSVLSALSTCKSLTKLSIGGPVPSPDLAELQRLPKLHRLTLFRCEISQATIDQISQMRNLQALELNNAKIDASKKIDLGKLKSLREICLYGPVVTDDNIATIAGLTNLKSLELAGSISAKQVAIISKLSNLERLTLKGDIDDDEVKALANLDKLEGLNILSPKLTGRTLNVFVGRDLAYLMLAYSNLSQDAFAYIAQIKTLKGLDLSSTPATDENIASLASLPQLTKLIIDQLYNATPYGASIVSHARPNALIDGFCELPDELGWRSHSALWPGNTNNEVVMLLNSTTAPRPFSELEPKLLQALKLSEKNLDDVGILECRYRIATLYSNCALYEKAIAECQSTIKDLPLVRIRLFEALHGKPPHMDYEAALTCRQYETRARLCLSESLRKANRTADADSILIELPPLEVRGNSYKRLYDAAFYNCVVGIRHKTPDASERRQRLLALTDYEGPADASLLTIEVRQQLAKQYLIVGDIENAEKFQREAYAPALKTFGARSQITQLCKAILADILIQKKQFSEAEQILRDLVPKNDNSSGITLPPYDFANLCDQYASLLRSTARSEEAAALSQRAMTIRMHPPQWEQGRNQKVIKSPKMP